MLKNLLVASFLLAVPFATGCSGPCGELADEMEACCADDTTGLCQGFADAVREEGDSDGCQQILDAGYSCGA